MEVSEQKPFQREERFIVIKRRHLSERQEDEVRRLLVEEDIETVECVVVEIDWPEYEAVWQMIEARCTGQALSTQSAELDALRGDRDDLKARYVDAVSKLTIARVEAEATIAQLRDRVAGLEEGLREIIQKCGGYLYHTNKPRPMLPIAEKVISDIRIKIAALLSQNEVGDG